MTEEDTTGEGLASCRLPRVTIQFCTQCKWMLRAAYYAQELLSTFSLALGEVALQPSTGGTFTVSIQHQGRGDAGASSSSQPKVLWDRKVDGGFPETKELKRRVRDVIEPGRDLGHVDRDHGKEKEKEEETVKVVAEEQKPEEERRLQAEEGGEACEDCK